MKTKPTDVPYCGVSEERIKNANPTVNARNLELMSTFIKDRYSIHLKKDVEQLPAPWTNNPILAVGKFTNVRREHDRQSKAYIEKIANANIDWFNKFWNTIMFRMFNRIDIFDHIAGGCIQIEDLQYIISDPVANDVIRGYVQEMEEMNIPIFTNAFNTGGLKQALAIPEAEHPPYHAQKQVGGFMVKLDDGTEVDYRTNREKLRSGELKSSMFEPNMAMRVLRYIGFIANGQQKELHEKVLNAETQKEAYKLIMDNIRGCSRFLSYQIFVDLTYCKEFQFSENEFTISGPGCDAGLNHIFDDFDGMNKEEALFWLRDNQEIYGIDFKELFSDLEDHDKCLNIMVLENLHCEFSKNLRAHEAIERGEKPRFKVSTAKLETPPIKLKETKGDNPLW